jgi:hypothetical protein
MFDTGSDGVSRRPASWQLDLLDLIGFGLPASPPKKNAAETAAPKQRPL